jgi:CRISPR-associated protein Cmr2
MIYDYYLFRAKEKANILNSTMNENKAKYNDFYPKLDDFENLPENSVFMKVSFTLKKPYLSKDEGKFHINDEIIGNPIIRDKFTRLPMVRPSTWKGHLRFAAERVECEEMDKKKIIKRLFGSESEEDAALKGRLYFFPTFFENEVERDVITPLKRDTRTPARGPINLEVMKPGKKGEFYLLYVPYPKGKNFEKKQVKEDLKFLAEALKLMFYTYGFSAKKTSGFGVIRQLEEKNVEVCPKDKQEIFSILYAETDKNVKDGASK